MHGRSFTSPKVALLPCLKASIRIHKLRLHVSSPNGRVVFVKVLGARKSIRLQAAIVQEDAGR